MASLPIEIVYGLYLGVLTGIIPALVSWTFGFVFKYVTGVTVPALAVVVLAVALAGVNGGLLALNDPTFTGSEDRVRLSVALIVVLMGSLYAHSAGDRMGASLPRRLSLKRFTERTLSTDVVELVGGRGQVRVTVTGDVGDIEGYPPIPADLREELKSGSWTFPADVPLAELETRVADRLRTEYDLADVSVTLDERARATVAAAPPVGGLSKRVPPGKRGVSVSALVPTGLDRGEKVTVSTADRVVSGEVLGVKIADSDGEAGVETPSAADVESPPARDVVGGEGRVTVAVAAADAEALLGATQSRLVVRSRGTRREYELISLLRRAGNRVRKYTLREGGALDGTTLGDASVRDTYGVVILAVRHGDRWQFAPRGSQELAGGDELFAVGTREDLTAFAEAAA
ncbi:potassium channel family protein [Salinirarus marinus]|uniref:potassium channel family protein n=1 Tax=Salinirarus marinus TaxID=3068310 RepID=UPI003C6CB469